MSRTAGYVNRHSGVIYLKQNKFSQLECAHFGFIKEESPSHIGLLANYIEITTGKFSLKCCFGHYTEPNEFSLRENILIPYQQSPQLFKYETYIPSAFSIFQVVAFKRQS
jgi:hypothetical protein